MNFSDNWTPLVGGNVNSVALKDNIVRRKLTAVSPVIHQLLKYLEAKNFYLTRMNADLRKQASLGVEPFVSFVAGGIADKLDRHKAYVLSHWLNY